MMALIPKLSGIVKEVRSLPSDGYYGAELVLEKSHQTYPDKQLVEDQIVKIAKISSHNLPNVGIVVGIWAFPLSEPNTWEMEGSWT